MRSDISQRHRLSVNYTIMRNSSLTTRLLDIISSQITNLRLSIVMEFLVLYLVMTTFIIPITKSVTKASDSTTVLAWQRINIIILRSLGNRRGTNILTFFAGRLCRTRKTELSSDRASSSERRVRPSQLRFRRPHYSSSYLSYNYSQSRWSSSIVQSSDRQLQPGWRRNLSWAYYCITVEISWLICIAYCRKYMLQRFGVPQSRCPPSAVVNLSPIYERQESGGSGWSYGRAWMDPHLKSSQNGKKLLFYRKNTCRTTTQSLFGLPPVVDLSWSRPSTGRSTVKPRLEVYCVPTRGTTI